MQKPTVCPAEDYLKSLNIPHIRFDFDDEDQLRKHLLSAMLCCPKKIDDGGNINADSVTRNIKEISGGCFNLYTIALAATKGDTVEAGKIAKNPERIFQLPVFARIVEMDQSSLKFRPIPRDISKSLYEKILRGSQKVRAREGQKIAAKAEELSRPENVYRMKVACNFLMELIDRERHSQGKDSVSWQSIQKRYENMVSEVDKRDEDLMNKYKCFGLDFTEPTLNSEVVKKLTCRSSITKALNQAVFYGIHYDNSSNVLMVGLNENARLYSEEELKKAAEACETSTLPNAAKSVYGRPSTPNQSSLVVPRSGGHPKNTLLYERNIRLPVSNVTNDGQNSGRNNLELPPRSNDGEALYVTTFPFQDDSSSEGCSEGPKNETGVYTTDEEKDVETLGTDVHDPHHIPKLSSDLTAKTFSSPNTVESFYSSNRGKDSAAYDQLSGRALEFVHRDNSMGTRMFQRECYEDSMPEVLESSARAPAPKAGLSNRTFAQPKYSNGTAHHRSAFGVYKAASTSGERESNWEKTYDDGVQHMASSSHHATKMNELYDRERNAGFQREFVHRSSNEQYQEEQCSRGYYDYAEGRFDPNLSNNSRTGDDSHAYLYQTCNPYAIEMDNSDKKIPQYKPCSVFDKCLDEETVINRENFRRSFGSGANVEKNVCNISNEMKGSEFANMCSTSDSKYKQRTGLYKSDRCYSEELVQRGVSNPSSSRIGTYRTDSPQRSFRNSSPYEVRTNSHSSTCQSDQNDTLRESTLSCEERVCLRMIRDFAYVYRNPTTHGFRTLENVVNLLPRKSVEYWIPLIQSHLPEVEIGAFHNARVLIWKGTDNFD